MTVARAPSSRRPRSRRVPRASARAAYGVALAAYVALFTSLAIWRWQRWSYGTDTGIFTQVVRNGLRGLTDAPEQGSHLRFHWSPILAVLTPLVHATASGLALQIAQVVLIAAASLALYAIARPYATPGVAAACASLALLYPPLCAVAFDEFHEVAFFPALALALIWAADRARYGWFAAAGLAASLVREDACMSLAVVGIALVGLGLRGRNVAAAERRGLVLGTPREPERLVLAGAYLALVNALALATYYGVVVPQFGGWDPGSRLYAYGFASGPVALVWALLTHPAYVAHVASLGRLRYLLEALVPLGFLCLRSWWACLAVPAFALILLASDPIVWHMGSHYPALWAPWLLLGATAVVVRSPRPERTLRAVVALCLLTLVVDDPMHVAHFVRPAYATQDARAALASLPPDAEVVTHYDWFAQVAYAQPRASVYLCPQTRYAVFDDAYAYDDYPYGYYRTDVSPEIARELATGRMRVLRTFGNVRVYAREPARDAATRRCRHAGDAGYAGLDAELASATPAERRIGRR